MDNILITSAGKRVSLIQIFQRELRKYDPLANVYTTEMNPEMSPAGIKSDGCFKVSRVTDSNYISELLNICIKNNIKLVIPTIDTELQILSENKTLFLTNGIQIAISDSSFISICRDKRKTNKLFLDLGVRVPNPIDKNHPTFPLFAKPYDGSLSKDIFVIYEQSQLTPDILEHPKLMFMEYIDKKEYQEFTVDMYYGRDNKLKCVIPRERIEIRAGEINKGITRKNSLVSFLERKMNFLHGVCGCICIQLFYNLDKNDIVGIEINPRFGGGYPLSYYAGGNYPDYLIREYLKNDTIEYFSDWHNDTLMLRYDSEVIVYK